MADGSDLHSGERQVSPTLAGIRRDHVARYEWAAGQIAPGSRVLDLACGVGYGSSILSARELAVVGIDHSEEAIEYARHYYGLGVVSYRCEPVDSVAGFVSDSFEAVVCFETIEHVADPLPMLKNLARIAPVIFASVPNERFFPHGEMVAFHHRHYTREEFSALLDAAGWAVTEWDGQKDGFSDVSAGVDGRTIVVKAVRKGAALAVNVPAAPEPAHVAILGLGPSLEAYVDHVKRLGARRKYADEVWGINAVADVIQCDRVFHMDDVAIQEIRAAARPASNIAAMIGWLKTHPGPIYTSIVRSGYPGLVAFPLEEVVDSLGFAYFNSTAAYAVALAIFLGVKKISLFGCDFTYPDAHQAEKGRGCVEFWLGMAAARGIGLAYPKTSTIMDALEAPGGSRIEPYGFDAVDIEVSHGPSGKLKLTFSDRPLPTADEIEARYDHSKHPSSLVTNGKG